MRQDDRAAKLGLELNTTTAPVRVFYSYSHRDESFRQELGKHLAPLRQEKLIDEWHDRRILSGENWERSISEKLDNAQVILLLVSSDFLASDYCSGVEMARAIERSEAGQAVVIPIIVRPCLWQVRLDKFKLQTAPKDALPITKWPSSDDAYLDVAERVYEKIQSMTPPAPSLRTLAAKAARRWHVPHARNPFFTARQDLLLSLAESLGGGHPTVLCGPAGCGKSAIAVEYAHRHRDSYEIVWWIRAEHHDSAMADLSAMARALGLAEAERQDQKIIVGALHRWLVQNPGWLLLFDNAADKKTLARLLPPTSAGHVVATSRSRDWDPPLETLEVGSWNREDSIAYLLARTGEQDRAAADAVADKLDDLPLALEQVAAMLDQKKARAA